jgi:hypothetical protein
MTWRKLLQQKARRKKKEAIKVAFPTRPGMSCNPTGVRELRAGMKDGGSIFGTIDCAQISNDLRLKEG